VDPVSAAPEAPGMRSADGAWTGGHNQWAIALTVTMATFMEVLDTSIANVSLPHIAGNLSASQDEATWVLTSYLVSNAIVLPISGWLATKIGRKRYYLISVALFTVSSFLCGVAPNLGALIFFRVVQGVGGGGLAPTEQSILADTFSPAKRGMAFAVYGMAVVLAPAIGPTLGGFITDNYSWRWIFFINIPVGLASMLLSSRMLVDPPHLAEAKKRAGAIDTVGIFLITIGLGALEVVLDKGQEDDWFHSSFIVGFTLVAAVALVAFVIWEWKCENPVVDLRLFKSRSFATATLMMLLGVGVTMYSTTVLLPQYMQIWMGYSSQDAGMVLSPGAFLLILVLPLAGVLVSKVDARWLIALGLAITSASLFNMVHKLNVGMDFKTAVILRSFQMVGAAFLFIPINTLVFAGVPVEKNNAVSGIVNLARNLGGDIGIAFVTTFIARRSQLHQVNLVSHADVFNPVLTARLRGIAQGLVHAGSTSAQAARQAFGAVYYQVVQQAQTLAYIDALFVLGVMTAIMVPLVFTTRKAKPGKAAMAH
jgi:DHA2 family multidrug resistance protein